MRPRRSALTAVLSVVVLLLVVAVGVAGFYTYQAVVVSQQPQTLADVQIQNLERQLAASPGDQKLSFQLAAAYFQAKDYDKASAVLDKVESSGAKGAALAETVYALAKIDETRGDVATAIKGYQRSLSIADTADARYALGMIEMQRHQYNDAITNLKGYVALSPMDGDVLSTLGLAYEKIGDKAMALQTYKKAFLYIPDDAGVNAAIKRLGGQV